MTGTPSGRRPAFGRRPALTPDARALIEEHVRELARGGRLSELAPSRDALAGHYRAQGDDAAYYCLATAPDFSLVATPGGGALLILRRSGHLVSWTQSELLAAAEAPSEAESRASQLAGGPDRFQAMRDDQRQALRARAEAEVTARRRRR